ncbi:MAG: hypothetical protein E7384_06410 [Ruminococcaceae bacterium]|nr:hypothetical protein [Oscillospiraceae bacterium]
MKRNYRYKIADLNVLVTHSSEVLKRNGLKYENDFDGAADIEIKVSDSRIEKTLEINRTFDRDYAEYFLSGMDFYQKLISFEGFMLHSSCVAVDGKGYLFTANSGTGKSTHVALWKDYLGSRATVLNDDKPAIMYKNGRFTVYGTPWSGKTDESTNQCANVSAVVFLERGDTFSIERISGKDAVERIMPQVLHCISMQRAEVQFDLIDRLLKCVPVFVMKCTPKIDSAKCAWEYLNENC